MSIDDWIRRVYFETMNGNPNSICRYEVSVLNQFTTQFLAGLGKRRLLNNFQSWSVSSAKPFNRAKTSEITGKNFGNKLNYK